MPKQSPPIQLSAEEKSELEQFVSQGQRSARAIKRAHILLQRDAGQSVKATSAVVGVSQATVYNICNQYLSEGVSATLAEKPRSGQPPRLNVRQQAAVTMLACSDPPTGHGRWTIRLLADKAVEVAIVEQIAPETIRQFLKKTNLSLG
jgi:transposase